MAQTRWKINRGDFATCFRRMILVLSLSLSLRVLWSCCWTAVIPYTPTRPVPVCVCVCALSTTTAIDQRLSLSYVCWTTKGTKKNKKKSGKGPCCTSVCRSRCGEVFFGGRGGLGEGAKCRSRWRVFVCVCVRVCVCAYFRQELVFRDGCAALLSGGMFGGVSPPKKKTLFVCSVEKGGAKDRTQKKHAHTQKHTHKSTHSTQHGRTISAPTQFTQPQPTTTERKNLNTPKNDLTPTNTHGTNALHNPPLVHTEPKQDETTRHQKNWT